MYVPYLFSTVILKEKAECPAPSNPFSLRPLANHARPACRLASAAPPQVAGGRGILEIWRNPLERLDSEKEMQGSERSFTVSRGVAQGPVASEGGIENNNFRPQPH
jgi:hypothetical protein